MLAVKYRIFPNDFPSLTTQSTHEWKSMNGAWSWAPVTSIYQISNLSVLYAGGLLRLEQLMEKNRNNVFCTQIFWNMNKIMWVQSSVTTWQAFVLISELQCFQRMIRLLAKWLLSSCVLILCMCLTYRTGPSFGKRNSRKILMMPPWSPALFHVFSGTEHEAAQGSHIFCQT